MKVSQEVRIELEGDEQYAIEDSFAVPRRVSSILYRNGDLTATVYANRASATGTVPGSQRPIPVYLVDLPPVILYAIQAALPNLWKTPLVAREST